MDDICNDCANDYDTGVSCRPNLRFATFGSRPGPLETDPERCDDCATPQGGYHHQLCDRKYCIAHGVQAIAAMDGTTECDCLTLPALTVLPN